MHTASDDWKDPIKDALKDPHRRGKLKSKCAHKGSTKKVGIF